MTQAFKISQTGIDAVKLLGGAFDAYRVVRNHIAKALSLVIVVPAALLLWGLLRIIRRKLEKASASFSIDSLDRNNYRKLRLAHDSTTKSQNNLDRFNKSILKGVPWYFKGLITEARRIRVVLYKHNRKVAVALRQLDAIPTEKSIFSPVSESELWKKRTHVIEYFA